MTSSRDHQDLPDSPADLLIFARTQRVAADHADAELMRAAVQWAIQHPAESIHQAETLVFRSGDSGVPVAGPGARWSRSSRWRSSRPRSGWDPRPGNATSGTVSSWPTG